MRFNCLDLITAPCYDALVFINSEHFSNNFSDRNGVIWSDDYLVLKIQHLGTAINYRLEIIRHEKKTHHNFRTAIQQNNTADANKLLKDLSTAYHSANSLNLKKGVLLALAAAAIGLGKNASPYLKGKFQKFKSVLGYQISGILNFSPKNLKDKFNGTFDFKSRAYSGIFEIGIQSCF